MIYCFDLDETLCTKAINGDYATAEPLDCAINKVNELYEQGNKVLIFTGRGSSSGIDWTEITKKQLSTWNLKHHELIMNRKPTYDIIIDDKAVNAVDWRKQNCPIKGVLAGAFDLIHPGYCRMFEEAKNHCDHLTVLLHEDPSLENKKLKPVHTVEERIEILKSVKYIDDVICYKTEKDLEHLLLCGNYDKRILGEDYKEKNYTGKNIGLKIVWINRDHGYSTTKLKNKLKEI